MDETQAISSATPRPFWKRDKVKLLSLLAFLVSSELFIGGLFTVAQSDASVILFPAYVLFSTLNRVLLVPTLIFVPLVFLMVGYFTFENLANPEDYPEKYGLQCLAMIVACVFLVLALFNIIANDWLNPIADTQLSNEVYRLAERHIFDEFSDFGTYVFYECSTFGIVCSVVYETKNSYEQPGTQVHLVAMPETNSVSIVINGETVYTYTPQQKQPA